MTIDYRLPHEVGVENMTQLKKYKFVEDVEIAGRGVLSVFEDKLYFELTGGRYYFAISIDRAREWVEDVYHFPYDSSSIVVMERKTRMVPEEYFAVML